MKLAARISLIKPSPTLTIQAKANALKAAGRDIIGFGAGEPDFDTPHNIKMAAVRAIEAGFTKYTPVGGIDELKDAVIAKLQRDNRLTYKTVGGGHLLRGKALALQYRPSPVRRRG